MPDKPHAPTCPRCGSAVDVIASTKLQAFYACRACGHQFSRPVQPSAAMGPLMPTLPEQAPA